VLVEGNLDRPRLATALGVRLPEGVGFSHQIHQRMTGRRRTWGIVKLGPSFALLAEPGPEAEYPAALHSQWFEASLRSLRAQYDYVVVDGPAVLGTGDANVLEDASDGLLLVARSAVTKAAALGRAAEQLDDRRILGVVLNGVAAPRGRRA
jgi:Mrp family chromosome partitioning ATPase